MHPGNMMGWYTYVLDTQEHVVAVLDILVRVRSPEGGPRLRSFLVVFMTSQDVLGTAGTHWAWYTGSEH